MKEAAGPPGNLLPFLWAWVLLSSLARSAATSGDTEGVPHAEGTRDHTAWAVSVSSVHPEASVLPTQGLAGPRAAPWPLAPYSRPAHRLASQLTSPHLTSRPTPQPACLPTPHPGSPPPRPSLTPSPPPPGLSPRPALNRHGRPPAAARMKPRGPQPACPHPRPAALNNNGRSRPPKTWRLPGSGEAGPRGRREGGRGGAAIERRAGAGQSAPQRLAVAGVAILDGGGERGGGGGQVGPRSGPGGDGGVSRLAGPRVAAGRALLSRALLRETVGEAWLGVRTGDSVPTRDSAVGNGGLDPPPPPPPPFVADRSRALQPARSPSGGPCPLPLRPLLLRAVGDAVSP